MLFLALLNIITGIKAKLILQPAPDTGLKRTGAG